MIGGHLVERLRSWATRRRTAVAVVANVVLCEVGARVGLPGVDGGRVRDFIHALPGGLLGLYDVAVGGAISRAALLALRAVPYFQARLYLWLARGAFPRLRRATEDSATRRSVVRLTTAGLAVVQSFGFARFLEHVPGAVDVPGVAFVGRTMLLLTGGAMAVGWLAELTVGRWDTSTADAAPDLHTTESNASPMSEPSVVDAEARLPDVPLVPLLGAGPIEPLQGSNLRQHADVQRDRGSLAAP